MIEAIKLETLLNHNRILCQFDADSKVVLIRRIVHLLHESTGVTISEDEMVKKFIRRERLGSTVLTCSRNIAIPHIHLAGITAPEAVLAILTKKIRFDSDDRYARIALGVVAPQSWDENLAPILESTRQFFSSRQNCDAIESASTPQDIMKLIRRQS